MREMRGSRGPVWASELVPGVASVRADVVFAEGGKLVSEVVEPRDARGEQGVGADAEIASGYPNGEGAVGVDLVDACVRVSLVEVETSGDGPRSAEHFGNVWPEIWPRKAQEPSWC